MKLEFYVLKNYRHSVAESNFEKEAYFKNLSEYRLCAVEMWNYQLNGVWKNALGA
jgi:hypothetical protein